MGFETALHAFGFKANGLSALWKCWERNAGRYGYSSGKHIRIQLPQVIKNYEQLNGEDETRRRTFENGGR